jgi:hypothetical protein
MSPAQTAAVSKARPRRRRGRSALRSSAPRPPRAAAPRSRPARGGSATRASGGRAARGSRPARYTCRPRCVAVDRPQRVAQSIGATLARHFVTKPVKQARTHGSRASARKLISLLRVMSLLRLGRPTVAAPGGARTAQRVVCDRKPRSPRARDPHRAEPEPPDHGLSANGERRRGVGPESRSARSANGCQDS